MINFIAEWDPTNPLETWSGTTGSFYNALHKRAGVQVLDAQFSRGRVFIEKFKHVITRGSKSNFNVSLLTERSNKMINSMNLDFPTIQVGDIVNVPRSFIYQDLSMDALLDVFHNNPKAFYASGFEKHSLESLIARRKFQQEFFDNGSTILSMSHWLTKFTNENTNNRAVYIGGGITLQPDCAKNPTRNRKRLLFVGRDFERKGGRIVVEAFRRLRISIPGLELVIAGPKSIPNEFISIPGLHFLGPVDRSKINTLMKESGIFVMPSRFEAFGLVFVEAMANGMPIVARNQFEMPYFVSEGSGICISSGSFGQEVDSLATAIHEILDTPKYFEVALEKSRAILSRYSWDNVARQALQSVR